MKKVLALTLMISTFSIADIVGGEINIGYYNHVPNGTMQYQGDTLDIQDTLNWDTQGDIFIKAYLEHPIPIIPNIKVGYSTFGHSGSALVNKAFNFAGTNYNVNSNIDSNFDLKMYDLTLYYELLDNWINVDVGVNVKYVDGSIAIISDIGVSEGTDFQVPIPMLYGKIRLDVPTTDLSFQVEGNYVTYDGHTLYDAEAGIRYTIALGLGLEAGYKTMKLKLDSIDDLSMESDFSGTYGKLVWDF